MYWWPPATSALWRTSLDCQHWSKATAAKALEESGRALGVGITSMHCIYLRKRVVLCQSSVPEKPDFKSTPFGAFLAHRGG